MQFTQNLPFYGTAILCVDDDNVRKIIPFISRPIVTYGFDEDADYRASDIRSEGAQMYFTAHRKCGRRRHLAPIEVTLNLPGRHNVLNALAAIALATELGVEDEAILTALKNF
ncbi:Mur ligase family protein, partial [Micrococcus luteus]|nr:Mur ligase family protein [Micrococcus luteus]